MADYVPTVSKMRFGGRRGSRDGEGGAGPGRHVPRRAGASGRKHVSRGARDVRPTQLATRQ